MRLPDKSRLGEETGMKQCGYIDDGGTEALFDMVPQHLHAAIQRYIQHGLPVGGFLQAVIRGDLYAAAARADNLSKPHLSDIAHWFALYAPATCYGSQEKYDAWIEEADRLRVRRERRK